MRYTFIERVSTPQGEFAYILDNDQGEVLYVPVRVKSSVPKSLPVETRAPAPVQTGYMVPVTDAPAPRAKSIVPAHLAGVFKEPGSPGEAIETRRV